MELKIFNITEIKEMKTFLKDYRVKDCIIYQDGDGRYNVWVDYLLMDCPHCHKKTPDDSKYCVYCGNTEFHKDLPKLVVK